MSCLIKQQDNICIDSRIRCANKVFKSIDNGLTWTNITFDLPNVVVNKVLNQVTGTATFEEIIYVATNVGVFGLIRETENSKKWIKIGKLLPNVMVNDLDINYAALKMYAATYGRGLWELDVNYSVNSTGINDNKISEDQFQLYPNPSSENQSIQIGLPKDVYEAKYNLYNYVGGNLKSGNLTKSENIVSMDGIVPGLYLLSLEVNNIKYCKKVVVQ
ncbi:MAG: T9SS type A sorting domain-containing protein [Saprospiraceae bacterium]|nr:T9SS type A sorting domain-containing protein [Saprospiraceae bacterium]